MHLTLLAVGRLRPAFREAADDYLRRLGHYTRFTETELKEAGGAPTPAEARRREAEHFRGKLGPGGVVVALDRGGKPWSSEDLARKLEQWRLGARPVELLIGGSHGLEPSLVAGAHERWSLGPLTLPHELARVVVLEQLYRAWTILRGEPYHK